MPDIDPTLVLARAKEFTAQHGLKEAARRLNLRTDTLARLVGGMPPRKGTLVLVAHALGMLPAASGPRA